MNEVIFIRNVNWKSFSKMTKSGAIKKKKKIQKDTAFIVPQYYYF